MPAPESRPFRLNPARPANIIKAQSYRTYLFAKISDTILFSTNIMKGERQTTNLFEGLYEPILYSANIVKTEAQSEGKFICRILSGEPPILCKYIRGYRRGAKNSDYIGYRVK